MKTQGRKNVHGKGGVRFKAAYTKSKYESMLRTLATDLIAKETVTCTLSTAKVLSAYADRLINTAKTNTVHARRLVAAQIRDVYVDEANKVTALKKLFDTVAPSYATRNGGYTKVLKIANRRGDNAPMAIVTLVK